MYETLADGGLKVIGPDDSYANFRDEHFSLEFYLLSGETVITPAGGLPYEKYSAKGSLRQGQTPVFYNPNSTSEIAPEIYVEIQELLAMASAVTTP